MTTEQIAKHTPGPWQAVTFRTSCGVCHKIGPWPHKWRAGTTMSACIYDDYPSPPEGTDTMLANARLISAAPELLEALTRILFAYGANSAEPEAAFKAITVHIDVALAALAKAEGR